MHNHPIITEARPLIHAQATLGEGAIWNPLDNKLYWVDILNSTLHTFDPSSEEKQEFPTGAYVGTVVPCKDGTLLVALQTGIHRLDPWTGSLSLLINPLPGHPVRFNDGKCDPSGRFWVGTIHMDGTRGQSTLYRFDPDGTLSIMLEGVSISNGIVWTSDRKTMYYTDTPTNRVDAFDYDDTTGNITNRRTAFEIPPEFGDPDGITIDSEDKLWIGMWGGSSVNRYDPITGKLLQKVTLPAPHTTSAAFGGPDLQTLYITSARVDLEESDLQKNPHSGDVFVAQPGVQGVPNNLFG